VTQRYDIVCLVVPQDKKIELAEVISRIITAVLGDLIPIDLSYQFAAVVFYMLSIQKSGRPMLRAAVRKDLG
jgi:hypothetical protein